MHGTETFAISEILQKAQSDHDDGNQNNGICMFEIRQRADQRDDDAGSRDHGETERIDLAAMDESGKFFAIENLGHGKGSLLAVRKNGRYYILGDKANTC